MDDKNTVTDREWKDNLGFHYEARGRDHKGCIHSERIIRSKKYPYFSADKDKVFENVKRSIAIANAKITPK